MALGEDVKPDYRALPRATYTDPEAASVGLTLEQATERGLDAFEKTADFTRTAKGYSVEAETGHVTIVVDRASHELVGAAAPTPRRPSLGVVAIKARISIECWPTRSTPSPRPRGSQRPVQGRLAQTRRDLACRLTGRRPPVRRSAHIATSRGSARSSGLVTTSPSGDERRVSRSAARSRRGGRDHHDISPLPG
jgi:hypothetical protein